jgi:hypothetical protein
MFAMNRSCQGRSRISNVIGLSVSERHPTTTSPPCRLHPILYPANEDVADRETRGNRIRARHLEIVTRLLTALIEHATAVLALYIALANSATLKLQHEMKTYLMALEAINMANMLDASLLATGLSLGMAIL